MALTSIARQLKEIFSGFNATGVDPNEIEKFRAKYGEVETIRIGEMNYIVINQVYESVDKDNEAQNVSPLFFNSINNKFAIIDEETSSTLIDEVYSRITYMQRICRVDSTPNKEEIAENMNTLLGEDVKLERIDIKATDTYENRANIFQCQLIKDTGVSAAPDSYSFMLKNGEIKEIAQGVMHQIKKTGEVRILSEKDRDILNSNKGEIQKAVYEKYSKADMDIQNVTVKSIFEICLSFQNIDLWMKDGVRKGIYHTSYLSSEDHEFDALNANIHVCNSCKRELVDLRDLSKKARLHINTDAYDPGMSKDQNIVHAIGCESCLVQCPDCHGWHLDYEKFVGTDKYKDMHLMPGREFIKGLRLIECNYCTCREGIEWVYDEISGSESEHDVIFKEKMAFINSANEKIASFEEYEKYYQAEKSKVKKGLRGLAERDFARKVFASFKNRLANKFDIDVKDIKVTSVDKCKKCNVCGGEYYMGNQVGVYDYRCNVCDELISEKRHMVVRIDGIVFMRKVVGKKQTISKYIVTKFGNLKKVSSVVHNLSNKSLNQQDLANEMEIEELN